MKLYGYDPSQSSYRAGPLPPSGRNTISSFAEEVKKTARAAAAEREKDTLELAKDDAAALRDRLTPVSKNVLDRMEAGKSNVNKDEWTALCKELETLGAISKDDFQFTRADFHFIPLGYQGENGEFIKYDMPPMLKNKLLDRHHTQGPEADGLWAFLDEDGWKGDPLAYLDNWVSSLYSWRSDLARARNGDGTPKYSDFSPITNQINSCRR